MGCDMEIENSYFKSANIFLIQLPDFVTLNALKSWSERFISVLKAQSEVAVVLDTGSHNFESIECLKYLKSFLMEDPVVIRHVVKIAFVSPKGHRPAEIVSEVEAYFSEQDDALQWIKGSQ